MPVRFTQVIPGVFRGGAPSLEEVKVLRDAWHVKRIVSLDGPSGTKIATLCKELGIEHLIIPIAITPGLNDSIRYLQRNIVSLLDNRPVYIHCHAGKDRTGMAIALFRIANGMSCQVALAEAKTFGFGVGLPVAIAKDWTNVICPPQISTTEDSNETSDSKKRRRALRKIVLQDMNDAMAEVGTFDSGYPLSHGFGLGHSDPYGNMPYGTTPFHNSLAR